MIRKIEHTKILSLCMIVRDEEKNLEYCLNDVKGLADEVIVVDTGSKDRTPEVAEANGAKVFFFDWMDDFSAARNESIRHAKGHYIIWLDADDRLLRGERRKLEDFKGKLSPSKHLAYKLRILNRKTTGEAAVSYQLRIFPNVEGALFEGRVHEQIVPSLKMLGIGIEECDIEIIHAGYKDDAAIMEKASRNLSILLSEKRNSKKTSKEFFHLAQCYYGIKNYGRSAECLERVQMAGKGTDYYKYSIPIAAECLLKLRQSDLAVKKLQQAVIEFPESGFLHYVLGSTLTLLERYKEALPYLEKAASLDIEVEEYPVPADIRSRLLCYKGKALEGIQHFKLAEDAYKNALKETPDDASVHRALGFLMSKQGRFEDAMGFLEMAKESSPQFERGIWLSLAKIYAFFGRNKEALCIYFELIERDAGDLDALTGLARAGIDMGNGELIIVAFNKIMNSFGINKRSEVSSLMDLASLASEIACSLTERGDAVNAGVFQEIALKLSPELCA